MDQEERTQVSLEEEKTKSKDVESNFIIIFGNSQKVNKDNDLFETISAVMLAGYDKSTFTLEFPKLLNALKSTKIAIETISSNNLQSVDLHYVDNIATHTKAIIFVTNPKPYNDQEVKA